MNTIELLQFSLGFAFDILGQVTADLTQEQADWRPPGDASTIGAIYSHTITHTDFIVQKVCIGKNYTILVDPPPEKITMQDVQVDLPALHEYARNVRTAAQDWLASLSPADLEQTVETAFGKFNLGQFLDAYIIWHINAHCGEISALKGCQGAKGYPF
jgi:hypothetical protein